MNQSGNAAQIHAIADGSDFNYDPDRLLDEMLDRLKLRNDAALSRCLEVSPPVISKIRHRRLPVGASLLIRLHEVSELSITDLRRLMGDNRPQFKVIDVRDMVVEQRPATESARLAA